MANKTAWENWSGSQRCQPAKWLFPQTEAELAQIVSQAAEDVRVLGAGHSFSALVPTGQTLISLDRLSGVIGMDGAAQQATCWAGTRIRDLGRPLAEQGLALINQG